MINGWARTDDGWERKVGVFILRAWEHSTGGPWIWTATTSGLSSVLFVCGGNAPPYLTEPEALAGALAWTRAQVAEMARAADDLPPEPPTNPLAEFMAVIAVDCDPSAGYSGGDCQEVIRG